MPGVRNKNEPGRPSMGVKILSKYWWSSLKQLDLLGCMYRQMQRQKTGRKLGEF